VLVAVRKRKQNVEQSRCQWQIRLKFPTRAHNQFVLRLLAGSHRRNTAERDHK
jgi:hypothetical protein